MGAVAFVPLRLPAVVAVLLVAGCGARDDVRVSAPPGYRVERVVDFGFAVPPAWRRAEEKDEQGRPLTTVRGPALPSGVPDGVAHAQRYADYRQGFGTALDQFRDLSRLNGYRLTVDRETRVGGAVRAHRFEASYELSNDRGVPTAFRLGGVYALTGDGTLVEFVLRAPQQGAAAARLPLILDSLRLAER